MSTNEILKELPKLSREDLRLVRQRLLELAIENSDVASCDEAALQGALMLDALEEPDAKNSAG